MAVPEQTPYIEHTGNSITTSFALGFQCETKDHLIVLVDDVEPPIATWSLTGGNVEFTTAPAVGKKITLQRNTPFSRTTDYQSYNNSFRPPAVNKDFDWIWLKLQELGVADWLMKLYVDRLHQQQEQKINDLRVYVDDRDDELRAYLLEEIRKQGVALDQLDEYYNYLMQRLAQIAVDKGWDASFIVDGAQIQTEINLYGGKKYDMPFGGYDVGQIVVLDNGYRVESIEPNNTNNPNINMTGWERVNYSYKEVSVKDFFTREQLKDCLTGDPQLAYSDAFQAAVDDAIANGSHGIFIPFDRGEVYNFDKTVNINASGFMIQGNRSPTYFRQNLVRGYIKANPDVLDLFNYNNGAVAGLYSSNQLVVDGVAAIGTLVDVGGVMTRVQTFIKHDTDNNGPHRGVLFMKTSAADFDDVLNVTTRTSGYVGAATVVLESGCVFNRNNCTVRGTSKIYGLRVSGIQSEQGSKFRGIIDGGITFSDAMLEGQMEPIDISSDLGSMTIENCYFEANTGEFVARLTGTSAPATFNLQNNFMEHMNGVVDLYRLSGIISVNAAGVYKMPNNRKSLISLIGAITSPNSLSDGKYYVGVTGIGVDGGHGFHSPKLLNSPRSTAVLQTNLGTDKIETQDGINPTGLKVLNTTSGYITVNQSYAIGDVMVFCALVKVKAGDSPQMQIFNEATVSMSQILGIGIQPVFDGTWQILYAAGKATQNASSLRVRFTSNSELQVAAVGADKVLMSEFETFNSVQRACVQLFNPLRPNTTVVDYVANPSYTIPAIAASASYTLASNLIILGASVGDVVVIGSNIDLQGVDLFGRVISPNYIEIKAYNRTSAPITLGAIQLKVRVLK